MNTAENNKLIAEFMGMQNTSEGWYDNDEALNLPNTTDNTFDELQFNSDWNWLMPVVGKLSNQCEEPEELDSLRMCLLCNDIEGAYSEVVSLIENL